MAFRDHLRLVSIPPPSFPSPPSLTRDIVEYLLNNSASLLVHDVVTKRTPLHAAGEGGGVCVCVCVCV